MLTLARREQTNGNKFLYSNLFLERLFEDISVSICQICVTDHPGHVVFLAATFLPGGEKMLQRCIPKVKPRNKIQKLYTKFPYGIPETSTCGGKFKKMPSGWKWLVDLFVSRNSRKYLYILQQLFTSET